MRIILKCLASVFLVAGVPAIAQQAEIAVFADYLRMNVEKVSAEVPFGDLDLRKDAGVETLNRRVEAEARRLCERGDTTVRGRTDEQACTESVMASARPQVAQVVARARQ